MGQMTIERNVNGIEGLCVLTPAIHRDSRGYFMETYNQRDLEEAGIHIHFIQDNQSMSVKGVLRGLHFQKQFPQAKLIRVIRGSVYDVAVDLRPGSDTYGRWYGVKMTDEDQIQFLIPRGFAHGFLVLSDTAEICYKCDEFYHPEDEGGILWNDPAIGIQWPVTKTKNGLLVNGTPLFMSEKDRKWPGFQEISQEKEGDRYETERSL